MKPPIVILEDNDISIHPSIEHVTKFLEPRDVTDGIYAAYDAEGWLLDLDVKSVRRERHFLSFRWAISYPGIVIRKHEPATNDSAKLHRKMIIYLNTISSKKPDGEYSTASLDQLIREVGKFMPWRLLP